MRKSLLRVLQVRRLLEESAGRDLQIKTAELRRLEAAAEGQRSLAAEARSSALRQAPEPDSWLGMTDAEIFTWRRQRFEAMAHRAGDEVAALHEFRMARRTERQQAEALLRDAERELNRERGRREQQRLDDWFQSRPSPGSRRSK